MKNTAPPQNMPTIFDRPHDTNKKSLDRRHRNRAQASDELEKLRALCHYQGILLELLNEKAEHACA